MQAAFMALVLVVGQYQPPSPVHKYGEGIARSVATKQNLVIWVGVRPRCEMPGYITVSVNALEGYPAQCVVLAIPVGQDAIWKATLPTRTTPQQIADAFRPVAFMAPPLLNCRT